MEISFKNIALLSVLVISWSHCYAGEASGGGIGDIFAKLAQKAEALYQNSSLTRTSPAPKDLATVAPRSTAGFGDSYKAPDVFGEYILPHKKPIMLRRKQFSDEWWKDLFGKCKGCEAEDTDRIISCEKMLAKNPQWEEVKSMNDDTKRIIMKRALHRFEYKDKACNLACALCAGCNPDERLDGYDPHTALHVVSMKGHYGLFNLLLRKGADPDLACQPALPSRFVPWAWKDELIKCSERRRQQQEALK